MTLGPSRRPTPSPPCAAAKGRSNYDDFNNIAIDIKRREKPRTSLLHSYFCYICKVFYDSVYLKVIFIYTVSHVDEILRKKVNFVFHPIKVNPDLEKFKTKFKYLGINFVFPGFDWLPKKRKENRESEMEEVAREVEVMIYSCNGKRIRVSV